MTSFFNINPDLTDPDTCLDCLTKAAYAEIENAIYNENDEDAFLANPTDVHLDVLKDRGFKVLVGRNKKGTVFTEVYEYEDGTRSTNVLLGNDEFGGELIELCFYDDYVDPLTCSCCDGPFEHEDLLALLKTGFGTVTFNKWSRINR